MYKKYYIFQTILAISIITLSFSCATNTELTKTDEQKVEIQEPEPQIETKIVPKEKSIKSESYYLITDIVYPEFQDKALLNKIIENSILSYYKEFEKVSETDWNEMKNNDENTPPFFYGTRYDFSCSKNFTSVLIKTEINSGGAHGNQVLQSYNYNEKEKTIDSDITKLTGYTYDELSYLSRQELYKKLSGDKNWIDTGTEPYPHNFEIFLVDDKNVTIYFEPYTVASYAEGIQSVKLKLKK